MITDRQAISLDAAAYEPPAFWQDLARSLVERIKQLEAQNRRLELRVKLLRELQPMRDAWINNWRGGKQLEGEDRQAWFFRAGKFQPELGVCDTIGYVTLLGRDEPLPNDDFDGWHHKGSPDWALERIAQIQKEAASND